MTVEREDALGVEGQIARETRGPNAREDELERLKRLQVHARWQRRVEALVEPLGEEHLVGRDWQLRKFVQHALQTLQVRYQVSPLLRALELKQRRLQLACELPRL